MADGELAHIVSGTGCEITAASAACGIAVFRELGLIETHVAYASGEGARMVRVKEGAGRVELTDSVRYREGLGERDIFRAFYEWVIDCDCARLEQRVSGPITPADEAAASAVKGTIGKGIQPYYQVFYDFLSCRSLTLRHVSMYYYVSLRTMRYSHRERNIGRSCIRLAAA